MISQNLQAFLDTIAFSEGTLNQGDDGYNVLFGHTPAKPKLFDSYADHPRVRTYETHDEFIRNGRRDYTTAAGRYQITMSTFDAYKQKLGLKDFGHEAQDAIAIQLIKERRALPFVEAGQFNNAVFLIASIWASLPGAGYGQKEHAFATLQAQFTKSGGTIKEA